ATLIRPLKASSRAPSTRFALSLEWPALPSSHKFLPSLSRQGTQFTSRALLTFWPHFCCFPPCCSRSTSRALTLPRLSGSLFPPQTIDTCALPQASPQLTPREFFAYPSVAQLNPTYSRSLSHLL